MRYGPAQRILLLAGIALVAGVAAVALTHRASGGRAKPLPAGVPVPDTASGWYDARAAPASAIPGRTRTACGQPLTAKTMGVAHPVLPCGAKIYIEYRGKEALTQVIDRGPSVPGREFDVTKPLANDLGLHGTQIIRWRFAR